MFLLICLFHDGTSFLAFIIHVLVQVHELGWMYAGRLLPTFFCLNHDEAVNCEICYFFNGLVLVSYVSIW